MAVTQAVRPTRHRRRVPSTPLTAFVLTLGLLLTQLGSGGSIEPSGSTSHGPHVGFAGLTVSSTGLSRIVAVIQTPPGADWSDSQNLQGNVPLAVDLSALVTGGVPPYRYSWNAGDGTPLNDSASWNHTFSVSGTYDESLVVTDAAGNTSFSSLAVVASPPRTAEYYATLAVSPSIGSSPLNASYGFGGGSWNPVAATFNFGDGNEANWTGQVGPSFMWSPHSHVYSRPGIYPLVAQVEEYNFENHTFGNTTAQVTVIVAGNTSGPWVSAAGGFTQMNCSSPISMNATFDAGVVGGVPPYQFLWSFGDATPVGSGASVRHVYPLSGNPGLLWIELLVEDEAGHVGTSWAPFLGPAHFASDCPTIAPPARQQGLDPWEAGFGLSLVAILALSLTVIHVVRRGNRPGSP